MVITQHRPPDLGEGSHEGLYLGDYEQHGAWSDECLTLECQPLPDGEVLASLSHDNASLTGDDIRWVSHYFRLLLPQVTSRPDCLIEDLDMLGPETIRQTLLWNEYPINTCARRIEQLFHERLAEWPSRTAVVGVDATMTYQELDQSSSALADKLRAACICSGDLVPLCLEKSATMISAILGLLKAGAAYAPMEIDLPLEGMYHIVREVRARIIVCKKNRADLCRQCNVALLRLSMDRLAFVHLAPHLAPASSEDNGVNKDMTNKDPSSDLVYIFYTKVAFPYIPYEPMNLLQPADQVPSLKMLDLGGEAMDKLVVAEWSHKVRLHNSYGHTEACIDACLNDQISKDTEPNNVGYGKATGNRLWIVEPEIHSILSPVGCLGELLISGPARARGYLNDLERTANAFKDCGQYAWSMKGDTRYYAPRIWLAATAMDPSRLRGERYANPASWNSHRNRRD
ncbi:MAG: hypothetical protein Q9198_000018 [Flavoplaca austrocitrina]